jgi:hypothetical protein
MEIIFEEDNGHTYHTIIDGKKVFGISVTTIIAKYKPVFQNEFWSIYVAVKLQLDMEKQEFSAFCTKNNFKFYKYNEEEQLRINYFLATLKDVQHKGKKINWDKILHYKEKIKDEWEINKNTRGRIGTEFHEYKEKLAHKTGTDFIDKEKVTLSENAIYQSKNIKVSSELSKLKDGYHTEVIVYNHTFIIENKEYNLLITGQIDKLNIETIYNVRYVDLDDYKTNKKIDVSNKSKMKHPISHLPDSKFIHYSLQLGLYGLLLEYHGFVVRNLYFTHHDLYEIGMIDKINYDDIDKENIIVYELKYYKYELEMMIKDYCIKNGLIGKINEVNIDDLIIW